MLTASALHKHLGGRVPVGAVESCQSATNVQPWTPALLGRPQSEDGELFAAWIRPLLPMRFRAVLWDQGEADAKRTNSSWYAKEFPAMVKGWRRLFQSEEMPFVYVELCTEYGMPGFWQAQRAALALGGVGFATTTDVQRALHPPDKQDVAARLLLEVRRLAFGESVVARGPELLGHSTLGKCGSGSLASGRSAASEKLSHSQRQRGAAPEQQLAARGCRDPHRLRGLHAEDAGHGASPAL